MSRPDILSVRAEVFGQYYWTKNEFLIFCKHFRLSATGNKEELRKRIAHFLQTGERIEPNISPRPASRFDWHTAQLQPTTILTDNYKNTANVRAFFQQYIGAYFHFTVGFLQWIKENKGKAKTLHDAARAWLQNETTKQQKAIGAQFEYNAYIKTFLLHHPTLSPATARACWNIKKQLPCPDGKVIYAASDWKLLGNG